MIFVMPKETQTNACFNMQAAPTCLKSENGVNPRNIMQLQRSHA